MIRRLLIVNRGEIALRIVRAARELGIISIVAHSEADTDTLAVQQADEAIWVNGQHELLKRDGITLQDIAHYPYIMLTVDEADQTAMKYWNPEGLTPNILFRTSSVEAVRSMVANGTGITILSNMVYRPWSLDGKRIEHIELSNPIPPMELGLSWPRNQPLSPAAKAFCNLAQSFSA